MKNKTREIADTPEKGKKRYNLYKAVIDRYLKARECGFYLEAITLMESLITDRLESLLIYYNLLSPEEAFMTLGPCINKIRSEQGLLSDCLIEELDTWRKARNQSLHEIAKIKEGDSAVFNQRYSDLKSIAIKGYVLFKAIKAET